MANTTIKISQLPNIGNNLTTQTLFPVVSTNGTFLTAKVPLSNIANLMLVQAGNTLPPALVANISYNVVNAAQPNITSVGTLSNLTVSNSGMANLPAVANVRIYGGANNQFLKTDGLGHLSWADLTPAAAGSNGQVQFNDDGLLGTDSGFSYNKDLNILTVSGITLNGSINGVNANFSNQINANNTITCTSNANTLGPGATVGIRSFLAVSANFGSTDPSSPASAQAIRGRITGSNLTSNCNYLTGVTGQYLITGTNASDFIKAGVLGVVGDQTTTADAAVVAYLDGDGGLTTANAAYGISMKNSTGGSGFKYGLDLQWIDLGLAGVTAPFANADIRLNNNVEIRSNVADTMTIVGNIAANNLGNIVSVNLDGNASNILHGDGTWSADVTDYSNSNVANYLAEYTGNIGQLSFANANTNFVLEGPNGAYLKLDGPGDTRLAQDNGNVEIWANGFITSFDLNGNINVSGNIVPNANITYDLGNTTNRFKDIWLANSTIYIGDSTISAGAANSVVFSGPIQADGNITSNANTNVSITTSDGTNNYAWTFSLDGNLTLPGNTVAINFANGSQAFGNIVSVNLDGESGNVLYGNGVFAAAPSGGGGLPLANGNSNFDIATIDGNVTITANGAAIWTFGTDGILTLANGNSTVQSVSNNAGDGSGLSTLNLVPDSTTGDDRYLIIDPTAPNHLHLRAGGLQDASNVYLYLGGEQAHTMIDDFEHEVNIRTYDSGNAVPFVWNFDNTGNLTLPGNISGNVNGFAIGYLNVPQVSASNTTLALSDAGKHYYSTTAGDITLTIPDHANVDFATGTEIKIVVEALGNILVNAASGVTLYLAGNSTAGNRTVGSYGMATLLKVATDTWFINGTGVS